MIKTLKEMHVSMIVATVAVTLLFNLMFYMMLFSPRATIEYQEAQHAKNMYWKCEKLYEYLIPPIYLRNVQDVGFLDLTRDEETTVGDALNICLGINWNLGIEYSKAVIDADESHSKFMNNYKVRK